MDTRDAAREERLSRAVAGARFGTPCYAYAVCGSTMDLAQELAREGAPEGTLVWAARQRRGRGRLGRHWESPEGGAYFSLILRPTRPLAEAPQLSLIAGLASAEAIDEQITRAAGGELSVSGTCAGRAGTVSPPKAGTSEAEPRATGPHAGRAGAVPRTDCEPVPAAAPVVSIRWPNDVLVDGKKVAGILTEASTQRSADIRQNYVVVGIGINVTTDPKELPESATSLQAALDSTFHLSPFTLDPLALAAALCRNLERWYDVWVGKGFAPIREALRPWLNVGQLVRVTTHQQSVVEGQVVDLDESGRLLVRLDSGVMRAFEAGEVTLLRTGTALRKAGACEFP